MARNKYHIHVGVGGRAGAPKAAESESSLPDNATIISTFRIRVDECDRLWVIDTGLADILGKPKQYAPPALAIFDLRTDQLIRRYTFPKSDVQSGTFFANVVGATTGQKYLQKMGNNLMTTI